MSDEEEEAYRESIRALCSALYIVLNTREEDQPQARQYAAGLMAGVVERNGWLGVTTYGQTIVH